MDSQVAKESNAALERAVADLQQERLAHERTRTELALTEIAYRRFVPAQFIGLMGANSIQQARLGQHSEQSLTILYSDIRNFTTLSESMNQHENFRFLNTYLSEVGPIVQRFGIRASRGLLPPA